MDADGPSAVAFEEACKVLQPKAFYCNPTLQNPTVSTFSAGRREELADVAQRYNVPIIEDDPYAMLPAQMPEPLALLAPELTYYVTGFSKCLGAGIRTAYVKAPDAAGRASLCQRAGELPSVAMAAARAGAGGVRGPHAGSGRVGGGRRGVFHRRQLAAGGAGLPGRRDELVGMRRQAAAAGAGARCAAVKAGTAGEGRKKPRDTAESGPFLLLRQAPGGANGLVGAEGFEPPTYAL
ncbi:hypothetical protein GCM10023144_36360 [Pigmentiphaga soli]|uniref:Aminotransferase class I/classII large domain-containing protein n=1 Tax=Pigmentiphaga soli TaxID=1007095 RepID=A0ABP8HG54_9BURK